MVCIVLPWPFGHMTPPVTWPSCLLAVLLAVGKGLHSLLCLPCQCGMVPPAITITCSWTPIPLWQNRVLWHVSTVMWCSSNHHYGGRCLDLSTRLFHFVLPLIWQRQEKKQRNQEMGMLSPCFWCLLSCWMFYQTLQIKCSAFSQCDALYFILSSCFKIPTGYVKTLFSFQIDLG